MTKGECTGRLLGLALLILACGVPASTSSMEGSGKYAELSRRIIWMDKAETSPMFLPKKILEEQPWDTLPLTKAEKERIRYAIEEAPKRYAERGRLLKRRILPCTPSPLEWQEVGTSPLVDFREVIADSEITAFGEIVAVVPGWSAWENRVNTVVYVRVKEIFQDKAVKLKLGDLIAFRQHHGSFKLRGQLLCAESEPGYYSGTERDQVVVVGNRWRADPYFLESVIVLPFHGGLVSSQGFTPIEKSQPTTLDEIRATAKSLREDSND